MGIIRKCQNLEDVSLFNSLESNAKIWRYMTMAQFCNLGLTGKLHMQSIVATTQSDPYEGLLPRGFGEIRGPVPNNEPWPWLTSSWCLSEYNNFALWEIYGDRQGVAIQTSVSKLKERLQIGPSGEDNDYHLFRIAYLDYDEEAPFPTNWPQGEWLKDPRLPYLCKRREFEHEREVRLLYKMPDDAMDELRESASIQSVQTDNIIEEVNIKPEMLVDSVCPHPKSERWVADTIKQLVAHWNWSAQFIWNREPRRIIPPFVPEKINYECSCTPNSSTGKH